MTETVCLYSQLSHISIDATSTRILADELVDFVTHYGSVPASKDMISHVMTL